MTPPRLLSVGKLYPPVGSPEVMPPDLVEFVRQVRPTYGRLLGGAGPGLDFCSLSTLWWGSTTLGLIGAASFVVLGWRPLGRWTQLVYPGSPRLSRSLWGVTLYGGAGLVGLGFFWTTAGVLTLGNYLHGWSTGLPYDLVAAVARATSLDGVYVPLRGLARFIEATTSVLDLAREVFRPLTQSCRELWSFNSGGNNFPPPPPALCGVLFFRLPRRWRECLLGGLLFF